jgi:hypothetical protein
LNPGSKRTAGAGLAEAAGKSRVAVTNDSAMACPHYPHCDDCYAGVDVESEMAVNAYLGPRLRCWALKKGQPAELEEVALDRLLGCALKYAARAAPKDAKTEGIEVR